MNRETDRQHSREIYLAARRRCAWQVEENASARADDVLVIEHIVRALIEVLTPEQRAETLKKVSR